MAASFRDAERRKIVAKLSPYQEFIAVSRYSRWIDEDNRRETWSETVDRYVSHMRKHLSEKYDYDPKDPIFDEVGNAVAHLSSCLIRKGDRKNLRWMHTAVNEVGNSVGQHPGLS